MIDPLPRLTDEQIAELLDLARLSIQARLESRPLPRLERNVPRLLAPQGAFVSLHLNRTLRGCVGMARPDHPLATTVSECAAAAATRDPRFDPLRLSELQGIVIEISVLDPLVLLRDPATIVPGTHGLMVTMGSRRGLLLPQVAIEHGWGVEAFLDQTCLKAGLPPDAWRRGAVVETFSAQVFSESDRPAH